MKHENIYRKFYCEGCVFVVNQEGLLYSAEVCYCQNSDSRKVECNKIIASKVPLKEISLQFYLRF